jgi:phage shock protein A
MKEWINKVLGNEKTPEAQLEGDAAKMLEELGALSEVTSFTMARADDKYEELTSALARDEALGEQAAEMLRAEDEEGTRRCLALQIENQNHIKTLQEEYSALQSEAEQKAQQFMARREAVETKMRQLPKLQDDARLIRQQEEIEKRYSALSHQSADRSFDKTAREIEMKKREMSNKQLLLSDPNIALDRRIAQTMQDRAVDRALSDLKERLSSGAPSTPPPYVDGEVVEDAALPENPVESARQLLSAPRYSGVLPQKTSSPVRKRP